MYPMPPAFGWMKLLGIAWAASWPILAGSIGGRLIGKYLAYLTFGRKRSMPKEAKELEDADLADFRKQVEQDRPPETLTLRNSTPQQMIDELAVRCVGEKGLAILIYSDPGSPTVFSGIVGDKLMCMEQVAIMMKLMLAHAKTNG